jgi:tyrosyl-tRNA synthetase
LVARYHGEAAGEEEQRWFETTFSERKTPDDVPELRVRGGTTLIDLLAQAAPEESKAALRRLLAQGGVRLGEEKVEAERALEPFSFEPGDTLKVGKRRWFKLLSAD